MEKYLVLYRSTMTAAEQMAAGTPEQMKAGLDAWTAWGAAAGDALVDWGAPTQPVGEGDPGPAGWVGGYSIMQAEDPAALQAILASHPHLEVGTIEVSQLLPMPGA
jgi:hypothetical protein